jgi:hypothetical protein
MRFTGQCRNRCRYLTEPGTGVGAGHRGGTVPGERLRHREAGMTFHGETNPAHHMATDIDDRRSKQGRRLII